MAYTLQETLSTDTTNTTAVAQYASQTYLATRWQAGATYTLTQVGVGLRLAASAPTGTLTAYVYADVTGGTPDPTAGTVLGTSTATIDMSTITGTNTEYLLPFGGVSIASGTYYWLGLGASAFDPTNYIIWARSGYNASLYINSSEDNATWTLKANGMLWAKTYITEGGGSETRTPPVGSAVLTGVAGILSSGIVIPSMIREA